MLGGFGLQSVDLLRASKVSTFQSRHQTPEMDAEYCTRVRVLRSAVRTC